MCEYLRREARYSTPDKHGETRRERNTKFGAESPANEPPDEGAHLLNWLNDAGRARRWADGFPSMLTLTEWQAWAELSGEVVRPEEMTVLRAMDEAYINAVCKELSEQQQRERPSGRSG